MLRDSFTSAARGALCALLCVFWLAPGAHAEPLELEAVVVTPHVQSRVLQYRGEADFSLGARTQLVIRNASSQALRLGPHTRVRLRGRSPEELLAADEWAWHDLPSAWPAEALDLPAGALTVWTFNGKRAPWGVGTSATLEVSGPDDPAGGGGLLLKGSVEIAEPRRWLSAVTFLAPGDDPWPRSAILHLVNHGARMRLEAVRLWLPASNATWRALQPRAWVTEFEGFPASRWIEAGGRGGARVSTGRLPLTYAVVEVKAVDEAGAAESVWSHLRIKAERLDISGGWIDSDVKGRSTLTQELFLKTLASLHVNTGHFQDVPGYTDNPELYARYPLRRFHKLEPLERYDTDPLLPRIHAVEFLGEPQYGGGRPVPPMDVWRALAPYQRSRLATTVTHSEERLWRFYAGLSDYPHFDAYRVCAPAADSWRAYDRWGGERISWGAPLETIGDLTRSLRELSRPAPIACWSQGAHEGWDRRAGRVRTSPTPLELRVQAYHAISSRVTSLYWFNLSLPSLLAFPDLLDPIRRVGRELRLLDDLILEGDATHFERVARDGRPDWDLSVVAGPRGALLFAMDDAYRPDSGACVFVFEAPRLARVRFPLPSFLAPAAVLRVDADGVVPVAHQVTGDTTRQVSIEGVLGPVNIFVAAADVSLEEALRERLRRLEEAERSIGFDPARRPQDLEALRALLSP